MMAAGLVSSYRATHVEYALHGQTRSYAQHKRTCVEGRDLSFVYLPKILTLIQTPRWSRPFRNGR